MQSENLRGIVSLELRNTLASTLGGLLQRCRRRSPGVHKEHILNHPPDDTCFFHPPNQPLVGEICYQGEQLQRQRDHEQRQNPGVITGDKSSPLIRPPAWCPSPVLRYVRRTEKTTAAEGGEAGGLERQEKSVLTKSPPRPMWRKGISFVISIPSCWKQKDKQEFTIWVRF